MKAKQLKQKVTDRKEFQKNKEQYEKTSNLKQAGSTGWGKVASWYDATVSRESSYQKDLILPAILKSVLRENFNQKRVLDVGCGTGFFSEQFAKYNPAYICGVDLDSELLEKASSRLSGSGVQHDLFKMDAAKLASLGEGKFDLVFAVESFVNMKDLHSVSSGIKKVLAPSGRVFVVVNHPAFRVPQSSDWYYDAAKKSQGRVVYKYKSNHIIKIDMNPGKSTNKQYTYTFHRSFEEYVNTFSSAGLIIKRVKEIYSHKKSDAGPRQKAEDVARLEIPMFLLLELSAV